MGPCDVTEAGQARIGVVELLSGSAGSETVRRLFIRWFVLRGPRGLIPCIYSLLPSSLLSLLTFQHADVLQAQGACKHLDAEALCCGTSQERDGVHGKNHTFSFSSVTCPEIYFLAQKTREAKQLLKTLLDSLRPVNPTYGRVGSRKHNLGAGMSIYIRVIFFQ